MDFSRQTVVLEQHSFISTEGNDSSHKASILAFSIPSALVGARAALGIIGFLSCRYAIRAGITPYCNSKIKMLPR